MGKSVRNTGSQETVSNKDDVLALMGGGDETDPQQVSKPKSLPKPEQKASTKDEVMDLLSGTVKKKDTDGGSSGTSLPSVSPSIEQAAQSYQNKTLTPEGVAVLAGTDQGAKMGLNTLNTSAKEVFATAHNGPKKADLVQSVTGIIDNFYPQSQDPKLNQKRFEIKQDVLSGNQDAILRLKSNIVQSIQKQIDQRENEVLSAAVKDNPGALGNYQDAGHFADSDEKIQQLRTQQKQVSSAIDEYGKQSLVSSNDMQAWLKLDAEHPNIRTSIAAEKLGKMSAEKYGAERITPNQEHDRMATGFRLIMQSLQMDINEALAYGIPSKNPELLKKAQDKVTTLARYKDMYDRLDTEQFPDVGLDRTARFLGDIISEKHPNKLIRTKKDVYEAALTANGRNPGFLMTYGPFVDIAAEKQDQGTFIPRGGGIVNELVGGLVTESAKSAIDLLKWKDRAVGSTDTDKVDLSKETSPGLKGTTQSRTEPTKIVYDKEGQAYREMPNENYGTLPWNNFFRFAGSSIPGLAEFIASEGVAKGAAQAVSFGRMSKAATEFSGLVGASYLTSYNSNREFADANIDDKSGTGEAKKIILANFLTMANAGVFHALNASPTKIVEKAISKAVAPDVMKLFEENSWEQLSQKTASSFIKDKILPRAKAIVEKFGESAKGGVKIGAASVIDQKVHDLAGIMTNNDFKPSTIEDNARSFVQQALLMTMVGGVAGMVSTGEVPHATKEALHQAGLYAPQYIEQINERVQNGELDPHKANGMIAMVKTMGEELSKAAQETTADGTPLTVMQQRDIAIANFRKRAAATLSEKGNNVPRETIESEADSEIKNIKAQNNWQAIEETPTFKSVKEVDENGKIGSKLTAMDDIDPTKQYTYDKEGEHVVTDGAALINHLETGDIYEKEKPDDQKASDQKTEDSKTKDADAEDKEKSPVTEPVSEEGKAAIKEANERKKEVEDAGFDFLAQEDDGGPYNKNRKYEPDEVPIGNVGLNAEEHGKGLGTLGYILKGEEYLKQGRHLVSDAPNVAEARTDQAEGVWKKLVKLGLATETSPSSYRYGGEREKAGHEEYKPNIRDDYFAKADFFTPKEKVKFESLDDAGKDKMIDDKRAELKEGKAPTSEEKLSITPENNTKQVEALQGSYDRLIASGMDPNDSEMKNLKSRIESLSPKTETNGNVKNSEGGNGEKGSPESEEGSEKNGQKNDEKGDVTPESDQDAGTPPGEIPASVSEETRKLLGITHEANANRRLASMMKEYEKKAQTFEQWDQAADKLLEQGYSVDRLIRDVERTGRATNEIENALLKKYISTLDAAIESNPTKDLVARRKRFVMMKDKSNSAAGRALVSLKGSSEGGDNLASFLQDKMESAGVNELTDAQIKEQKAKYEELKKTSDQYKAQIEKLKSENSKLKAQKSVDSINATAKKKGKNRGDFVKERKDIIEQMRQDLLRLAKGQSGLTSAIPGVAQLATIAPHVGKLVVSLAEEGINKLDDLINRIHDEVKDVLPGITKNNVRDIIAGEYKEKKDTRSDLSERVRNLKREAELINKLEKVRKGEDTKDENKQFEKSRRIIELEKKISEIQKINKKKGIEEEDVQEANKTEKSYTDKLADRQNSLKKQIADTKEKIAKKIYSDEPSNDPPLKLDKKTQELQDKLIELKRKRALELSRAEYSKMGKVAKFMDKFWQVLGLKRVIQTAVDFSMPFRQAVITTMNPLKLKTTGQAFKNMFIHTFQPKEFKRFMFQLEESGLKRDMAYDGMTLSEPDELVMDKREEEFRTSLLDRLRQSKSPYATPVKWLLEPVFASERAAASYMNTVRINEYIKKTNTLKRAGITRENNPQAYKDMSKWIMNSTGRGNMLKFLEDSKAGKEVVGNTFYGARLMASRFNMLNPAYYTKMPKSVRVEAMKDMAGFTSGVLLSGLALAAAGGNISLNPDEPDFMQVRFGDKVYDLTGGMIQYIRTFLRIATLAEKRLDPNTDAEEVSKYSGFVGRSATKFFTNKLAPNTAYAYHFLTGRGGDGKDFNPTEILEYYPMYVDDMKKGIEEDGASSILTILMPNIFGMGVMQYEKKQ